MAGTILLRDSEPDRGARVGPERFAECALPGEKRVPARTPGAPGARLLVTAELPAAGCLTVEAG